MYVMDIAKPARKTGPHEWKLAINQPFIICVAEPPLFWAAPALDVQGPRADYESGSRQKTAALAAGKNI